jgi:hypothetical protein
MAGPVGTRLRRLEKRLGLGSVPVIDGDEPEYSDESRAILGEIRRVRLGARLGREPSDAELAEDTARAEARRVADEARLAEAGIKLRLSDDNLLILEKMQEERARARALACIIHRDGGRRGLVREPRAGWH